jgi:hypothetical protein
MGDPVVWICCGTLAVVFGVVLIWAAHRTKAMLVEWGRANGFEILSHKEDWTFPPESLGRSVFRVEVRDSAGRRKRGTARCETRLLGLLPEEIAVQWDE